MTPDLRSLPRGRLAELLAPDFGAERYRADQLFSWLHGRLVEDVEAITVLPARLRQQLARRTRLVRLEVTATQSAPDGTTKLALETEDGHLVETVLIPEEGKLTQCVSTQIGCRMGCSFCATARLGLKRHLTAGEIVAQVAVGRSWAKARGQRLSNLVFMGMGEPLDNYEATVDALRILTDPLGADFSTRRVTVSTVGHVSGLERLAREDLLVNLAVSLNATTQRDRARLMPAARRWPLGELLAVLETFPLPPRRRITLEYVLLPGTNDRPADATRLGRIARRLKAKVNLIPFNPFPNSPFRRPTPEEIDHFAQAVRTYDVTVLVRRSRGGEIQAACGQLAGTLRPEDLRFQVEPIT